MLCVDQSEEAPTPRKMPPVSVPAEGRLHLLPFLLPTHICDADNEAIIELRKTLIPPGTSHKKAAQIVRDWVRENIRYTLDDKRAKASETLAKMEG